MRTLERKRISTSNKPPLIPLPSEFKVYMSKGNRGGSETTTGFARSNLPSRPYYLSEGQELEFHDLACIFPMPSDHELEELAKDITKQGLLEPIVVYEDKILDGRCRYLACKKIDIPPHCVTGKIDNPLAYVLSRNLQRRHLNESQRVMIGAKIATNAPGTNRFNRQALSIDEASALLNVSEKSISRAKTVLLNGEPDLVAAVESGRMSVAKASSGSGKESRTRRERPSLSGDPSRRTVEIDVSVNELEDLIKLQGHQDDRAIMEIAWEFREGEWIMFVSKGMIIRKSSEGATGKD
jgi:hypothetical protein